MSPSCVPDYLLIIELAVQVPAPADPQRVQQQMGESEPAPTSAPSTGRPL